ncbi:MAG: DUF1987 domain-containing protein [bacterium]|nr:DUF1987 domain-containing protein [bacterium]
MNTISYEPTNVTPYVYFNPENGVFEIKGRSLPDTSLHFYQPIISALDKYINEGESNITANFAFEYFNTSSSKCVFDIIKRLKTAESSGKRVVVNWCFEEIDEDMKETGEDYESIIGLQFNYIAI